MATVKNYQDREKYIAYAKKVEAEKGIPENLLVGLLGAESAYREDIITGKVKSSAGAIGIGQFMLPTAKEYGINPLDPYASIEAAGRYLKSSYKTLGNWEDSLRSYNMGVGGVQKWKAGKRSLPKETEEYVGRVYDNAKRFGGGVVAGEYIAQEQPIKTFTNFESTSERANFASVPDLKEEEVVKQTEDTQKLKEEAFLDEYSRLIAQPQQEVAQQEEEAQSPIQQDFTEEIFNEVSQFVDGEYAQQGGNFKKAIYVDDKNDPRYRAYKDSLLLYNLTEAQRLKGTNNKKNYLMNSGNSDVLSSSERAWYKKTRSQLKDKFYKDSEVAILIQGEPDSERPKSKENDYNNDEYFHPDIKPIKGYNWSTATGLTRLLESNDNFLYKKPNQPVQIKNSEIIPTIQTTISHTPSRAKIQSLNGNTDRAGFAEANRGVPTAQEMKIWDAFDTNQRYNLDENSLNLRGGERYGSDRDFQGVNLEQALRAQQYSDNMNADLERRYNNENSKNNPKAQQRLEALRHNLSVTPTRQEGGKFSYRRNNQPLETVRDNTQIRNNFNPALFSTTARNLTEQELKEKKAKEDQRIANERIEARRKADSNPLNKGLNVITNPSLNTRENWAETAAGLESQFRVSDKPNFFDDYLNPANMVGGMAANLGSAPKEAKDSNSVLPYFTSLGAPLAVGALAGIGSKTTGQFVNNVANPLAGTGDLVKGIRTSIAPELRQDLRIQGLATNQKFKSEIKWGKWNKEIPENKDLIQEYNAIEQQTKANGTWMKNPDGSTFEGVPEQFVQQNSKNFKNSFGNTKFKDSGGNPMILHHGHFTDKDFSSFLPPERSGISSSGYDGDYSFFTPHKSLAEDYAGIGLVDDIEGYNSYVKSVYVNSNNPLIDARTEFAERNIPKSLRDGRDAITASLNPEQFSEVAVPYGNNVKSATGNNGMFNMKSSNIYKSVVPVVGASYLATQGETKQQGGIIDDNEGQWKYPGEVTRISSPNITMKGVPYPVLGVADTGEQKMMFPELDYTFKGAKTVTEYPKLTEKEKQFLKVLKNDRTRIHK